MKNWQLVPALWVVVLGTFTLGMALGAAPTLQTASKQSQAVSPTMTIRGVLLKSDKTPLASDLLGAGLVLVTAAPVKGEGEDGVTFELTHESVNKNTVETDARGRFTIKMARSSIESKKLVILIGGTGFNRLQHLQREGKPVVIEVNDKTSTVNLGTIVVKEK